MMACVDGELKPSALKYTPLGSLSNANKYTHDNDQTLITLRELEKDKEDLDDTDTLDKVALFQILYYKRQSKEPEKVWNRKKGDMGEATYERIVFLRCVLSDQGSNMFAIMMSKQRNSKLFDQHLTIRDHQGIKLLPVRVSDDSERMSCFHFPKATMKLLNFDIIDVPCKGTLCDGLNMYKDGRIAKSCACISNSSKSSRIIMVVKLKVIPSADEDGNVSPAFVVADFTSHNFTWMFVKGGAKGIPSGLSSMSINANGSFLRSYQKKVKTALNGLELSITGWSRRGTIVDQGSATKESIKNSMLNHHLVSITCNATIGEDQKVDLTTMVKDLTSKKRKNDKAS
jgi:hypothetical protein